MEQYIDKDAIVAEIEKRKNLCEKIVLDLRTKENKDYYQGKAVAYSEMVELFNTPEVEEVDLEKETRKWWKEHLRLKPENQLWMDAHMSVVFAKHFFELGLKAQKGE